MLGRTKTILLGLACATALTGTATAGGFGRGTADTDILYEEGPFNIRSGLSIVAPKRGYDTISGVAATDPDFTQSYAVFSGAGKANFRDNIRCAGTYIPVYGASTQYGPQKLMADRVIMDLGGGPQQTSNATHSVDLNSDEFGLTCSVGFDVGPGRAWVIGGGFMEDFKYTEVTDFGTLSFDGGFEPGYRIGAAYEIPKIALRAQLLYRSAVTHAPGGTYLGAVPDGAGGYILAPNLYETTGAGTTPQSLELKVQSGIMADTLAFASVKWTEWSVVDTLDYIIDPNGGIPVANSNKYYWKNGWTVSGGVGRRFNETVSGSVSLTWDQGVSTGYDLLTDTWTLASGVALKASNGGEFRAGLAVSYLTAGSQQVGKADFDATVGGDIAIAGGAGFHVKF